MNDIDFMRLAIKQAKQSNEKIPVGVVIIQNGQILSKSFNSQHTDRLITSHAEIKAIKEASSALNDKNLSECTLYTTCEPCTMCAGALFYSKIKRIVYGARMSDIDPENERIKITIEELSSAKKIHPEISQFMREECLSELYKATI